jgi:hypothetical protein
MPVISMRQIAYEYRLDTSWHSSSKRENTGDVLVCNTQTFASFTTGHCKQCSYNPKGPIMLVKWLDWQKLGRG